MVAEERNLSPNLLNLSSHLIQSQGERTMNLSLTLEQKDVFHVTPDLPDWVSKKNKDIMEVWKTLKHNKNHLILKQCCHDIFLYIEHNFSVITKFHVSKCFL